MIDVSDGYDFVVPKFKDWFEPLHAIYSRNCIGPIESIINQGRRVIIDLIHYVNVRYIEPEEMDRFDPQRLSFFNINTRDDLERARQIAGGASNPC